MALKALMTAALVSASRAASPSPQEAEGDEGRFFLTGTGNPNQTLVVGNANLVLVGLVVAGCVIAVIVAAFVGRGGDLGSLRTSLHGSPSSYESSYAVHRALEETPKKHK